MRTSIALVLALLVAGRLGAAEFTRESLATEIGAMKAQLTGIDVAKATVFIGRYLHPDELKAEIAAGHTLDAIAKTFVEDQHAAAVLELMSQLDLVHVEIDAERHIIACKHRDELHFDKIRFAFLNDAWFVMNE